MLIHTVVGPDEEGFFLVVYPTPGCLYGVTVAKCCRTKDQADTEADRLNVEQIYREKEVRWVRELRGLTGVYPDLEGIE